LVCSAILPIDWLVEPCPNDAYVEQLVHKDQLLQDPLTFKQNNSYELFWFFNYIFSFFFTFLVVHPHHDHPVTTVLTHTTLLSSFFITPDNSTKQKKHSSTK